MQTMNSLCSSHKTLAASGTRRWRSFNNTHARISEKHVRIEDGLIEIDCIRKKERVEVSEVPEFANEGAANKVEHVEESENGTHDVRV